MLDGRLFLLGADDCWPPPQSGRVFPPMLELSLRGGGRSWRAGFLLDPDSCWSRCSMAFCCAIISIPSTTVSCTSELRMAAVASTSLPIGPDGSKAGSKAGSLPAPRAPCLDDAGGGLCLGLGLGLGLDF